MTRSVSVGLLVMLPMVLSLARAEAVGLVQQQDHSEDPREPPRPEPAEPGRREGGLVRVVGLVAVWRVAQGWAFQGGNSVQCSDPQIAEPDVVPVVLQADAAAAG